jgi:hypothetical protein
MSTNDENLEMTKKALFREKQRAIRIRVIKVNEKDHWQIWLGRDVVVIIWAISDNMATLLNRVAYYNNWRQNNRYF